MPEDLIYVYFDIEITGLSTTQSEIIQIGCKYRDKEFIVYVAPLREIPRKISDLTKLSKKDGQMFNNGIPVISNTLYESLSYFLDFLKSIGKNIMLVAHIGVGLPRRLIFRAHGMTESISKH